MTNISEEELNFGIQMDGAEDKQRIIDLVVENNRKNVLDIGAGTGYIASEIAKRGIKATAVDNFFKVNRLPKPSINFPFYAVKKDIISFLSDITALNGHFERFDCIILSAVLHELSKGDFAVLKYSLSQICTKDCLLIIREPYYEEKEKYYAPFKSAEDMKKACCLIDTEIPSMYKREYGRESKSNREGMLPEEIKKLGLAFAYSYGDDSWEREKLEFRYTFSKQNLIDFCKSVVPEQTAIIFELFDKEYKTYFNKRNISPSILDCIDFTNCLIYTKNSL